MGEGDSETVLCNKCKREIGQIKTVKELSYLQVRGGWYIREGLCECDRCHQIYYWYGTTHDRTRLKEYARRERALLDKMTGSVVMG